MSFFRIGVATNTLLPIQLQVRILLINFHRNGAQRTEHTGQIDEKNAFKKDTLPVGRCTNKNYFNWPALFQTSVRNKISNAGSILSRRTVFALFYQIVHLTFDSQSIFCRASNKISTHTDINIRLEHLLQ